MGQKYILKYFLGAEDDKQLLRIAKEKELPVIDIMDKRSESYVMSDVTGNQVFNLSRRLMPVANLCYIMEESCLITIILNE